MISPGQEFWTRDCGLQALDDELIGVVVGAVRPSRPNGHGDSWEMLLAHQEKMNAWGAATSMSIVKVEQLLTCQGVNVPYRTSHQFAVQRCGFRPKDTTVRVLDGEPWFEQCAKHGQALVAGLTPPRQFAVRAVGGASRTMRALNASRRWTWLKRSL